MFWIKFNIIHLFLNHKGFNKLMPRRHWSFFISNATLALFLGIIIFVVIIAFARDSGSTGLDMAAIQKMRHDAVVQDSKISFSSHQP